MRRKLITVIIALVFIMSIPEIALGATTGTITGGVNFRSAPSVTNSKIYRTIPKGTKVTILQDLNRYWVKISSGNRTGYISKNYVSFGSNQSSVGQSATSKANSIINYGKRFLGVPYKFGAEYPTSGKFDCSSFTQYVYAKNGITLPRVSRNQAKVGSYVSKSNIRQGDLLFFTVGSSKTIGHVGIYVGNNQMLHTYGAGGVKITSLNGYWNDHYVTARRVIK